MQNLVATVILSRLMFTTLVNSQSTSLPTCMQNCYSSFINDIGCAALDIACICNSPLISSTLFPCARKSCSTSDYDTSVAYMKDVCAVAGVSINVPGATSSAITPPGASSIASTLLSIGPAPTSLVQSSSIASSLSIVSPSIATLSLSSPSPTSHTTWDTSVLQPSATSTAAAPVSKSSSLSTGAVAGLAVGATLVAVAVVGALVGFCFWKRRKGAHTSPSTVSNETVPVDKGANPGYYRHELEGGEGILVERKELEDGHGLRVARDRKRVELP